MENTNILRPTFIVLNDSQKERIHSDSLEILSTVGVRVESEEARRIFSKRIGSNAVRDDIVRIPSEVVYDVLKMAPSTIKIYNRKGDLAFQLPGDTRFGIGVTDLYYQDPKSDSVVPFTREHMTLMVRLGEKLPSFDAICTIGILQDVPVNVLDVYSILDMISNTIKPLVVLVSDENAFLSVIELMEDLHGDLSSKPFIIPFVTPIAPLVINRGTVDKMIISCERGLPVIYSSGAIAGATAPITAAESLCQLNAQLLAGLTLSQLIREGTPIILGYSLAFLDMKGQGLFADPNSHLVNQVCAEMMDYYHLPHYGRSGSGMGWGADIIHSGQQWMNHLISCMGKVGLAAFVGSILDFKVFSPAVVVYANEVIEQARLFAKGLSYDDNLVALDEIAEAGPGGNFLSSDLTLNRFRQAYYQSDIFPQLTLEEWQEKGSPRADDILRRYTKDLIDNLIAPADYGDLMEQGRAFIRKMKSH
jgi:trimethylamine--corrinoid protein Co-methyltransferase